ncbi:hypothetical protein SmJEL517_g02707 [Synchytrium microbalum]|uniref:Hexosyltransferase n=1 Tax=Synchytrium microbalum TaxID=1806994 RepID=A0A507CAV8_9FUNG|nr:uncharacterized protein SmJEL517_g02707 [Synchytrium microbalum]TPX34665.1 hypothetical protein SmJEL517_g02707 [Synchytrium microbalum]
MALGRSTTSSIHYEPLSTRLPSSEFVSEPLLPPEPLVSLYDTLRRQQELHNTSSINKTLLLGIFTTADRFSRRHVIRLTYLRQRPATIDYVFVIGRPRSNETDILAYVSLEIEMYSDILILDEEENMNGGKTYEWFSRVGRDIPSGMYMYVHKGDDDVWLMIQHLEHVLTVEGADKREGTYLGLQVGNLGYMAGWGYFLSYDLVKWISIDPYPRQHKAGHEDVQTGVWLNEHNKVKNFWNMSLVVFHEALWNTKHVDLAGPMESEKTMVIHNLKGDHFFILAARIFIRDGMPKRCQIPEGLAWEDLEPYLPQTHL